MYISRTVIKIISAALWIGAFTLALYCHNHENTMSKDLFRLLDIVALVMAVLGFIVGRTVGLFPGE